MKLNSILTKILIIFILTSLVTLSPVKAAYTSDRGTDTPGGTAGGIIDPYTYNPKTGDTTGTDLTPQINSIGGKVVGFLTTVGAIVAVIALAIIGLKYTFASLESRAEYKKQMVPYVVGAAMVGGISIIVNVLYNFAQNLV